MSRLPHTGYGTRILVNSGQLADPFAGSGQGVSILSGLVQSGYSPPFQLGGGEIASGQIGVYPITPSKCQYCGGLLSFSDLGISCNECYSFDPQNETSPREQWIRESIQERMPFNEDASRLIIADYLEENGRTADANYLRELEERINRNKK